MYNTKALMKSSTSESTKKESRTWNSFFRMCMTTVTQCLFDMLTGKYIYRTKNKVNFMLLNNRISIVCILKYFFYLVSHKIDFHYSLNSLFLRFLPVILLLWPLINPELFIPVFLKHFHCFDCWTKMPIFSNTERQICKVSIDNLKMK